MTVFAIGSLHGAPGATTLTMALAAAWRSPHGHRHVVVEADPDGGVLAARFGELAADRTLVDLAAEGRRRFDPDSVLESARSVWGRVPVVVAPPSAEQTYRALAAAERLAAGLAACELDILVDVGRLTARSPALPLARHAVLTVLLARPSFEHVALLATRAAELTAAGCRLGLVVVGDRPNTSPPDAAEVAASTGLPLVAALPGDARVARLFAGGPGSRRHVPRSLFWRAVADLADWLAAQSVAADAGPPIPTTSPADGKAGGPALIEDAALARETQPSGAGPMPESGRVRP